MNKILVYSSFDCSLHLFAYILYLTCKYISMSFFVCLSGNSSHTIVPKGLNFSGFEVGGGSPWGGYKEVWRRPVCSITPS